MRLRGFQQVCLIALRTAIGWHFAYEGLYKLMLPGWSRSGQVVASWSAEGYLKGATGPLAPLFTRLAQSDGMMSAVDTIVPLGLLLVGLSLMLGLLTQIGCVGAMGFLALFYLSQPPFTGMPQAGAEGAYLLVNKNLIELVAVMTIMAFRTGAIAGLDRLLMFKVRRPQPAIERHRLIGWSTVRRSSEQPSAEGHERDDADDTRDPAKDR